MTVSKGMTHAIVVMFENAVDIVLNSIAIN